MGVFDRLIGQILMDVAPEEGNTGLRFSKASLGIYAPIEGASPRDIIGPLLPFVTLRDSTWSFGSPVANLFVYFWHRMYKADLKRTLYPSKEGQLSLDRSKLTTRSTADARKRGACSRG